MWKDEWMNNERNTHPSTYAYCISSFSSPSKIQDDGCENEVDSIKEEFKKLRKKGKGKWYAWGKKREICKIEKKEKVWNIK